LLFSVLGIRNSKNLCVLASLREVFYLAIRSQKSEVRGQKSDRRWSKK